MQRFFGTKRAPAAAVSLDDAAAGMENRGAQLEGRIRKLDQELAGYRAALAQARTPGARALIKQKAMRVLKQRRQLDRQLETMQNQQMNLDQARLTQSSLQDSLSMVSAMQAANQQLRQQMTTVKIADVENLYDDMAELLEDADAMNEVLGQTFGVPDDVNEDDLMNELDALDDELLAQDQDQDLGAAPDYLTDALRDGTAATATTTTTAAAAAPGRAAQADKRPVAPNVNVDQAV